MSFTWHSAAAQWVCEAQHNTCSKSFHSVPANVDTVHKMREELIQIVKEALSDLEALEDLTKCIDTTAGQLRAITKALTEYCVDHRMVVIYNLFQ